MPTVVKTIEIADLWRRYRADGDARAREGLIVAYSPLVKFVAGRLGARLPRHVEESDLIGYGLVGLIGAIERFDPEREVRFETFASLRIRGAILDELRALDWVPRSVRARARAIEQANVALERRLQRTPSDEELAAEMQLTLDEFHSALAEIASSTVVALDGLWAVADGQDEEVGLLETLRDPDAPDPVRALAEQHLRTVLTRALQRLPERERTVIALAYGEGLKLREIGLVLGVSESRVSQMHTKAVLRLRSWIHEDDLPAFD